MTILRDLRRIHSNNKKLTMNDNDNTSINIEFNEIITNDKSVKVPPNSYGLYGNSRIFSCSPPPPPSLLSSRQYSDFGEMNKMFYIREDEDEDDALFNKYSLSSSASSMLFNNSNYSSIGQEYRSILDAHVEKISKSLVKEEDEEDEEEIVVVQERVREEEEQNEEEKNNDNEKVFKPTHSKSLPINISKSTTEKSSQNVTSGLNMQYEEPLFENETKKDQQQKSLNDNIIGDLISAFEVTSFQSKELIASAQPYQYGTSPYQQSYMKKYSSYSCTSSMFAQSNSNSTRSSSPTPLEDDDAETLYFKNNFHSNNNSTSHVNSINNGNFNPKVTTSSASSAVAANENSGGDSNNVVNRSKEISYDYGGRCHYSMDEKITDSKQQPSASSINDRTNSYYNENNKWNSYSYGSSGDSNKIEVKGISIPNDNRHGRHNSNNSSIYNSNYSLSTTPENEKEKENGSGNINANGHLPSSKKSSSSLFSLISKSLNNSANSVNTNINNNTILTLNNSINSRRSSFSNASSNNSSNISLSSSFSSSTLVNLNPEIYQTILENEVYRQQTELQKTMETKSNEKKKYQQYLIDLEKEFTEKSLSWNSSVSCNPIVGN